MPRKVQRMRRRGTLVSSATPTHTFHLERGEPPHRAREFPLDHPPGPLLASKTALPRPSLLLLPSMRRRRTPRPPRLQLRRPPEASARW
jgi:hypothetical protein